MKKIMIALLFGLSSMLMAHPAEDLIRTNANDVTSILKIEKDPNIAKQKIQNQILPYFDFDRMTALAVGKNWRTCTSEQKVALTNEFKKLLIKTYSSALVKSKVKSIQVKPTKIESDDIMIVTDVILEDQEPINISYYIHKKEMNNDWKVYDVIVAGVSLVTNYRSTFSESIKNDGIDGLIKLLKVKNG